MFISFIKNAFIALCEPLASGHFVNHWRAAILIATHRRHLSRFGLGHICSAALEGEQARAPAICPVGSGGSGRSPRPRRADNPAVGDAGDVLNHRRHLPRSMNVSKDN